MKVGPEAGEPVPPLEGVEVDLPGAVVREHTDGGIARWAG
jgi:hypothetical protein